MSLKDLPAEMRPREKLLSRGGAALSDVELLALLLRTGLPGEGVFELATQVLQAFGGFAGLLRADAADLQRIKGLGPAKRAEIAAVIEMARRALAQPLQDNPVFDAPQQVKDYVALHLGARTQEVFTVLFLDGQHRLLRLEEMFHGTLAQTRGLPARGGQARAAAECGRRDPGAQPPVRRGRALARRRIPDANVESALQLVDVRVLDHLVVGHGSVVSFAERGLL